MDVDGLVRIITDVGFPVVACGALYWNNIRQQQRHEDETRTLSGTIDNNTKVLTELTTLIKTFLKHEKE